MVWIFILSILLLPVYGEQSEEYKSGTRSGTTRGASGKTLYVGGTGPGNYSSIQEAINNASEGDTVYVYSGTYYETGHWFQNHQGHDHYAHFFIRKSITLIGEDKNTTIIEGNNYGHVIDVRATNVTIQGFTIRKSGNTVYEGHVGLNFNDADNCLVTDNIFTGNRIGIATYHNHRLTIKNNIVHSNTEYGICIHMYSHADKGDTIIESNEIFNNSIGIYQRYHYHNPGKIINNRIYNNDRGIEFLASYDKFILKNVIKNNNYGIYFGNGDNNTITDNFIKSNNLYGIYLTSDQYVNNPSVDNHIYHNQLISNGIQAYDDNLEGNNWNHTTLKEGNYWSDYLKKYPNATNDGKVWNPPYIINNSIGAKDYYPLVKKISNLTFPPTITTENQLEACVGVRYSVNYSADDLDTPKHNLTWSMNTNASWLNFSSKQELFGTPKKSDIGSWWVNISVSDGNNSDYTNFTLTVFAFCKPEITTNDVKSVYVGERYYVVYSAYDLDTPKKHLTWSMRTNASWLNFSSKQELSGTPSSSDVGSYWVNISVSDGINIDFSNFTLTVKTYKGPQIITIDNTTAFVGERYSVFYSAKDPDTPNDKLIWSMKSNASWLNFSAKQELFGIPAKSDIGSYWVNISVSDGMKSDFTEFTLIVKSKEETPKKNGTVINIRTGKKYLKIQPAIDEAKVGDTIYVQSGTYYETGGWFRNHQGHDHYAHLLIRKSITLTGEDKKTTIIEGNNYGHVIDVRASNVTIQGFTIRKSGDTVYEGHVGLNFNDADNCLVIDNIFTGNRIGIATYHNHRLTIKNNIIHSNAEHGIIIHMYSHAEKGETIIDSNEIFNNTNGIYQRFHYDDPGAITNNKIYNNDHGIDFLASHDKFIAYNEISNNNIGIYFEAAINNTIKNNTIMSNTAYGLYLTSYDPYPKTSRQSYNNLIYHNNIIKNGKQAYDSNSTANNWNHTKLKEGNYWSDYQKRYPNATCNGTVWNIPYDIDVGAKDYYPLGNITSPKKVEVKPQNVLASVLQISIDQESENVSINTSEIEITFSQSMDSEKVESYLLVFPEVDYSVVWEENDTVLKIIFNEKLFDETTYTISLGTTSMGYYELGLNLPLMLIFTTEEGEKDVEDEAQGEEEIWDTMSVIAITFVIITIIIFLILLSFITKKSRLRHEQIERTQPIEEENGIIVTNGHQEVIYELKDEALTLKKPSQFEMSKEDMVKKIDKKYRKGELSSTTYESIKEILGKNNRK
jgi:parallel beta-helix repeat protein